MTDRRETYHCFCGFAADHPGLCPHCKEPMHPRTKGWREKEEEA